ncbi:MAG TPA: SUMF1/EgtB/PvdO family nonheme iron enzyme, partial [Polyangiaceae bacterium]
MRCSLVHDVKLPRWLSRSLIAGALLLVCGVSCGGRTSVPADLPAVGGASTIANGGSHVIAAGGSHVIATGGTAEDGGASAAIAGAGAVDSGGRASAGSNEGGSSSSGTNGTSGSAGTAGTGESAGAGGMGETTRSCINLAATCGPSADASCCASSVVPGGTFDRIANGDHFPVTVSDFALDRYEITVGRFRAFVAAYTQAMIPAGAGKNPNNPADAGWDPAWNASLDLDAAALKLALKCDISETWTDSRGSAAAESLPINCLTWFEAEAFCTWDNGRLPTDAEWGYVASGGNEQRSYPWGNASPDCTYANFFGAAGGMDFCVRPGVGGTNRVGSESPKGDSKWGHADLAGNVAEWAQDWARPFVTPCNDCALLTQGGSTRRVIRGGSFEEQASAIS